MPLAVQAKILRAVETKRVSRINGKREIAVDVRIIAAGNRGLAEEVLAGRFRKDLFYRINVLRLTIPALREVREDTPLILDAFLASFAAELQTGVRILSDDARAAICAYDWPGNVRQLRNFVESSTTRWKASSCCGRTSPRRSRSGRRQRLARSRRRSSPWWLQPLPREGWRRSSGSSSPRR